MGKEISAIVIAGNCQLTDGVGGIGLKRVNWKMVGQTEFALTAGYGRMIVDPLPNGLLLYRSHIEITEPVELIIYGDDGNKFIGTQYFLMGHGEMELSSGERGNCTPDHAILLRADTSPTTLRFLKPQVLRHIGVSKYVSDYQTELNSRQGGVPAPFNLPDENVNSILRTSATNSLRTIGSALSQMKSDSATNALMLHAQSLLFFSKIIQAFEESPVPTLDEMTDWELDAVRVVKTSLDETPFGRFDIIALSRNARMSTQKVERGFRAMTGHSVAEYSKMLKLNGAQELLLSSDAMIKQISHDVGYDHVGNFSRAYKNFFGESPNQTRRRNL